MGDAIQPSHPLLSPSPPAHNPSQHQGLHITIYKIDSQWEFAVCIAVWLRKLKGFPCASAGKESTCNEGDLGSVPGLGRSPAEGKGYPLQYSGLENSVDYIVHGIAKSRTRLRDFHFQETQTGALYQPRRVRWGGRWEGISKGRGYMCTYGWFMLRFDGKQQNSVKQLFFNKKIKKYIMLKIIKDCNFKALSQKQESYICSWIKILLNNQNDFES